MRRFFDLGILLIFSVPILILFSFTFVFVFYFKEHQFFLVRMRRFQNKKIKIYKFRSMKKVNNNNIVTRCVFYFKNF